MGLGPSIKMTSLHHHDCPVTSLLMEDGDVDFAGVIVDGISEVCDDKEHTAVRTSFMAEGMRADGAIVAIDGWGNHHVDFVSVIEHLGRKGIPSVGLSYIGLQGRLVCSNEHVDTVVDFNKSESGYESCVVGQNELTGYDAMKAVALLKNKLRKRLARRYVDEGQTIVHRRLVRKTVRVEEVALGEETSLRRGVLTVRRGVADGLLGPASRLKELHVDVIRPGDHDRHVNSNLDFMPVACKASGALGEGVTHRLSGVTLMLNGVEDVTGFQPSNIGSSEGVLKERVAFGKAGTPAPDDWILHVDALFKEGEGRTAEGIIEAHACADRILDEVRKTMRDVSDMAYATEELRDVEHVGKPRVVLVKLVSGLGNMYDTSLFPWEPAGWAGSRLMRLMGNMPVYLTGTQVRDGAIHSLL